jgi:hypothetical protein
VSALAARYAAAMQISHDMGYDRNRQMHEDDQEIHPINKMANLCCHLLPCQLLTLNKSFYFGPTIT